MQDNGDISVDAGEPHYLGLDHTVHLTIPTGRLRQVRADIERLPWPPDLLQVQGLGDGGAELRALYRAGTMEFAFRIMARLLARLERP